MKNLKIYFVGIKGVGMAPLAIIAKQANLEVRGSDIDEEFITDSSLKKEEILIDKGFKVEYLNDFFKNSNKEEILLITTGAHGGFDNPQTRYAREQGIKVLTQGEAVGYFMEGKIFGNKKFQGISILGCHGKTTITAMIATYLSKLNYDPTFVVGTGEISLMGLPGHFGKGDFFIAEADEYASEPKYDKVPKFLYQHPRIAILNNIDYDHPDFYKNIEEVEKAYFDFVLQIVERNGVLIINGDDLRLLEIKKKVEGKIKVITYGSNVNCDYWISKFYQSGLNSFFNVETKDIVLGEFSLSVPGYHNAKNSLSCIALLNEIGVPLEKIKDILPSFKGTKRRMEVKGQTMSKTLVIDDYAHHPSEIKTTLSALKKAFPERKIICVFQPHTYSRTKALLDEFAMSFHDCSNLIVLPVYASLREKDLKDLISDDEIISKFKITNNNVIFFKNPSFVIEYIDKNFPGEEYIIITMGAGDVYKISDKLVKK